MILKGKRILKIIIFCSMIFFLYKVLIRSQNTYDEVPNNIYHSRKILEFKFNCSPKSLDNFPSDLFTLSQKKSGALIIHFLVTVYMFVGVAIVCEDYFVPSLEVICENLKLQPDVAGATFMAAGSSAPELATTMIGVFISKDDIGLGAVVGSADYNLMLVIGLAALFAPQNTMLNWWPLFRDNFFYSLSIIILGIIIYDGKVYWYESLTMFLFYGVYVVLNFFNPSLEVWAKMTVANYFPCCSGISSAQGFVDEIVLITNENVDENEPVENLSPTLDNNAITLDNESDCNTKLLQKDKIRDRSWNDNVHIVRNRYMESFFNCFSTLKYSDDDCETKKKTVWWKVAYHYISLPLRLLLCLTVPDCRLPFFKRWFWVTFFMCCVWISVYSYIMIWMITVIGDVLGIPDTVMGITFIAAGSSVPDAISSVIVVREGQGDMAVSNAVGSNVFDVLVCMGLPWFLKSAISGVPIYVYSKGLLYATVTLFATVFMLILITHLYGWRMRRNYGIILIIIYFLFLIICSLYELNIFGKFHPPTCT